LTCCSPDTPHLHSFPTRRSSDLVRRLPPIAIGPAVETAITERGQIVGRGLVAEAVALVDHRPELAGRGLPCHGHRVAQAAGKNAASAITQIELVDRISAFLCLHAAVG